jgi:hypothetical protein
MVAVDMRPTLSMIRASGTNSITTTVKIMSRGASSCPKAASSHPRLISIFGFATRVQRMSDAVCFLLPGHFGVIEVTNVQNYRDLKTGKPAVDLERDANPSILLVSPRSLDARHFYAKFAHCRTRSAALLSNKTCGPTPAAWRPASMTKKITTGVHRPAPLLLNIIRKGPESLQRLSAKSEESIRFRAVCSIAVKTLCIHPFFQCRAL